MGAVRPAALASKLFEVVAVVGRGGLLGGAFATVPAPEADETGRPACWVGAPPNACGKVRDGGRRGGKLAAADVRDSTPVL